MYADFPVFGPGITGQLLLALNPKYSRKSGPLPRTLAYAVFPVPTHGSQLVILNMTTPRERVVRRFPVEGANACGQSGLLLGPQ